MRSCAGSQICSLKPLNLPEPSVQHLKLCGPSSTLLSMTLHPPPQAAPRLAPWPGLLTMGFLNSLGLIQRTKKGWQAPRVRISSSSDRLNWLLSVGERFLVSAPCGGRTTAMGGADLRPSSTPGRKAGGEVSEVKA